MSGDQRQRIPVLPGQVVYLNLPSLSRMVRHPYYRQYREGVAQSDERGLDEVSHQGKQQAPMDTRASHAACAAVTVCTISN